MNSQVTQLLVDRVVLSLSKPIFRVTGKVTGLGEVRCGHSNLLNGQLLELTDTHLLIMKEVEGPCLLIGCLILQSAVDCRHLPFW